MRVSGSASSPRELDHCLGRLLDPLLEGATEPWAGSHKDNPRQAPKFLTAQVVHLAHCLDRANSSRQGNYNRERVINKQPAVQETIVLLLLKSVSPSIWGLEFLRIIWGVGKGQ